MRASRCEPRRRRQDAAHRVTRLRERRDRPVGGDAGDGRPGGDYAKRAAADAGAVRYCTTTWPLKSSPTSWCPTRSHRRSCRRALKTEEFRKPPFGRFIILNSEHVDERMLAFRPLLFTIIIR